MYCEKEPGSFSRILLGGESLGECSGRLSPGMGLLMASTSQEGTSMLQPDLSEGIIPLFRET